MLDKRVPIAMLVGLLLQTVVFSFWMGGLSQQVNSNTTELRERKSETARLAVVETKVDTLTQSVNNLTTTLQRVFEREKPRLNQP